MKTILLDATSNNDAFFMIILYLAGGFLLMAVIYHFYRYVFSIDKRIKQNDEIISLLKKIADK